MAGETRTGVSLRPGIQLICEEVHLIARLGDLNAVSERLDAPEHLLGRESIAREQG